MDLPILHDRGNLTNDSTFFSVIAEHNYMKYKSRQGCLTPRSITGP